MPSLRLAGRVFPVACYAAPRSQWVSPDSVLGPLEDGVPVSQPLDPRFEANRLLNGAIYALRRLRIRPVLRVETRLGWYFDSLSTSETLELDLLAGRAHPARFNHLDGSGRTAGIGVATLTALRTPRGFELLLGRIAPKSVPHRAGRLHVIPSGMFAPPYSVTANVENELREELGLELGAGRFYLAGVAVNLLNLRPEICTLFVVDDPGALRPNAEFQPGLLRVPLSSDARLVESLDLRPDTIVPPGVAALFLGVRLLRQILKA